MQPTFVSTKKRPHYRSLVVVSILCSLFSSFSKNLIGAAPSSSILARVAAGNNYRRTRLFSINRKSYVRVIPSAVALHLSPSVDGSRATFLHSSWKESDLVTHHYPSYRSVLTYLADMIEYCRRLHRHELEAEYRDAWETAASSVYGPLPPRRISQQLYTPPCVLQVKEVPRYRQLMLAKPLRKIVARTEEHEVLECGHMIWQPVSIPGAAIAKRRRCPDCAKEAAANKKPPARARPEERKSQRA